MTKELCLQKFIETLELTDEQKELLNYNLTGGKYIRGLLYKITSQALQVDYSDNLLWCIEILQAYFLITDDIIDNATVRRNKPSWFCLKGIKTLNHAIFLQCLIFKIIKKQKNYTNIAKLFQKCTLATWMGQAHDTMENKLCDFSDVLKIYNFKNYNEILIAKTCFYTLILPINLGFVCAGKQVPENFELICQKFAFLMQFQDDYLNFFPELSGKSGNDVQEKKVTWHMCKLVEKNKGDSIFEQKMMTYIAKNEYEYINEKINELLKDHDMYEQMMIDEIVPLIAGQLYFEFLFEKVYKRRN
ncbi:hypothetical protein BDAP_000117 [Binucleata daphniae]